MEEDFWNYIKVEKQQNNVKIQKKSRKYIKIEQKLRNCLTIEKKTLKLRKIRIKMKEK